MNGLARAVARFLQLIATGLTRLAHGLSRGGETRSADAQSAVRDFHRRLDGGRAPEFTAPRRANWLLRIVFAGLFVTIGLPLFFVGVWRVFDPPFTWLMVERMLEGESLSRRPVSIDDISPHLVRAVIAAEDSGFCAHDGFDVEAIQKALANNAKGRKIRGGSTISQQTAKNVFLWADRSWLRKGIEAYFTVLIEAAWPKRRIMEAYLNAAEWGDGRFGAEAAAQELFGKSAKDLTPREAARLAAILPSPNKWRADKPGPYVRRRAATIVSRMAAVRAQGLDACVFGGETPTAPSDEAPRRRREAPVEALPPLPAPPEAGPESDPLADTPQLAPLEAAPEAIAPAEPLPAEAPPPAPETASEPASAEEGPVDLRPPG